MYQTVWLLAATFAAAGNGDAQGCAACAAANAAPAQQVIVSAPQGDERPGLFARLAERLRLRRSPPPAVVTAPAVMQPVARPAIQPVAAESPEPAVALPKQDVAKEVQGKVGHAEDYTWITGQLQYVHANGGVWVLRYAALEEEDKYGGSVVLTTAVSLKNFRDGDLVSVSGEVLNEGRANKQLGGALYRATDITMIERADP